MPPNDPRVFFAAERTLLAWVRTGIALIGLGFVVAKFGLFLRLVAHAPPVALPYHGPLGAAITLFGSLTCAVSVWQHRRFCRTLTPDQWPPGYLAGPALGLGVGVAAGGLMLAILLVI